jgi:hypothetical protein
MRHDDSYRMYIITNLRESREETKSKIFEKSRFRDRKFVFFYMLACIAENADNLLLIGSRGDTNFEIQKIKTQNFLKHFKKFRKAQYNHKFRDPIILS